MSTRQDQTPYVRLQRIARFLSVGDVYIDDEDVQAVLRDSRGDAAEAERRLRASAAAAKLSKLSCRPSITREERISKAAMSLAPHPDAIQILQTSMKKVLEAPQNERFRKVNITAAGPFKDRIASRPGGIELLYSVGYEPMHGHLVLQTHDRALLKHALHALQEVQKNPIFCEAKATQEEAQAAAQALADADRVAEVKRKESLAKVPAEPKAEVSESSASVCVLNFSVDGTRVTRRRFESDNTLQDVVHYVRSLKEVPIDATLRIENVTTAPFQLLDPDTKQKSASLYALDLWPVGHIGVTVQTGAS